MQTGVAGQKNASELFVSHSGLQRLLHLQEEMLLSSLFREPTLRSNSVLQANPHR